MKLYIIMQDVIPYGEYIWNHYASPYSVASFDLGNKAFGVAYIVFDRFALLALPRVQDLELDDSIEDNLRKLEWLAGVYKNAVNKLITIWVDVWNLMPDTEWKDVDVDRSARNLKPLLTMMDDKLGPYDEILYEFQMNRNDKSRTISSFVRYHYAGICPVVKVVGSLKNTVHLTPELNHNLYLTRYSKNYDANKQHAADSFRYLANVWGYNINHIPSAVMKDAGDAVMQAWAHLLHKIYQTPTKPKTKTTKKKLPRRKVMYDLDI